MSTHENEFSVKLMCHVLGVKRRGYFAWKYWPLSSRAKASEELLKQIREAFDICRKVYGTIVRDCIHLWVAKAHQISSNFQTLILLS